MTQVASRPRLNGRFVKAAPAAPAAPAKAQPVAVAPAAPAAKAQPKVASAQPGFPIALAGPVAQPLPAQPLPVAKPFLPVSLPVDRPARLSFGAFVARSLCVTLCGLTLLAATPGSDESLFASIAGRSLATVAADTVAVAVAAFAPVSADSRCSRLSRAPGRLSEVKFVPVACE